MNVISMNYENFLKLEVIWKDEHILELEITVSNNGYSGVARGYDTADLLRELADQLKDFPKGKKVISHNLPPASKIQGDVSITIAQISPTGTVGVKVYLQGDGSSDCQKSYLLTELRVELSAIDTFQKYLATLAANQHGVAVLIAK